MSHDPEAVTYRVVKIEPCEHPAPCGENGYSYAIGACQGCRGDGTRMVDVAEVELAPDWWWSPIEQAATAGPWGHGDDRAVWVEVES